jgi:hypothetical protein
MAAAGTSFAIGLGYARGAPAPSVGGIVSRAVDDAERSDEEEWRHE